MNQTLKPFREDISSAARIAHLKSEKRKTTIAPEGVGLGATCTLIHGHGTLRRRAAPSAVPPYDTLYEDAQRAEAIRASSADARAASLH
jgi:hypothetical protein